jgi:uncharacterized protein involved in exopolysaccharide biosynthesis
MSDETLYYLIIFLGVILGAFLSIGVLTALNKFIKHKEKQG